MALANVSHKQCVKFMGCSDSENSNDEKCIGCGYNKEDHLNECEQDKWTQSAQKWRDQLCLYNIESGIERDCRIRFINQVDNIEKMARFVKVSADNDPKAVVDVLLQEFNLHKPKIVISIAGAPTLVQFKTDILQNRFRDDFIKAATATSTWILTNGTNFGFDGFIADALKQDTLLEWIGLVEATFHLIGVCNWNCIEKHEEINKWLKNRKRAEQFKEAEEIEEYEKLIAEHPNVLEDNFEYRYKPQKYVSRQARNFYMPLNPATTHFLCVENGMKLIADQETDMRCSIDKYVASKEGLNIPTVLLLFGGNISAFKRVAHALREGMTVVICQDSGDAANILSRALSMTAKQSLTKKNEAKLIKDIENLFCKKPSKGLLYTDDPFTVAKHMGYLKECLEYPEMIVKYRIGDPETTLDGAILKALLCGNTEIEDKLKLTVKWNKCDKNVTDILDNEKDINLRPNIEDIILDCLLNEQIEFIQQFMEYGLKFSEVFKIDLISKLYQKSISHNYTFRKLLRSVNGKKRCYTLKDVYNIIYKYCSVVLRVIRASSKSTSDDNQICIDDPFREICIWATFSNKPDLCYFAWQYSKTPLMLALIVSELWKVNSTALNTEDIYQLDEMQEAMTMYRELANEIMVVAWDLDKENTRKLVALAEDGFDGKNTIDVAKYCVAKDYIASACVQSIVDSNWTNGFRINIFNVMFGIFYPWSTFKYYQKDIEFGKNQDGRKEKDNKYIKFYTSPICKFVTHTAAYIIFLGIYTYFYVHLLNAHSDDHFFVENILFMFMSSYAIEEFRKLITDEAPWRLKMHLWMKDEWNIIDAIYITTGLFGYFVQNSASSSRILYCGTILLMWIHLLRFYQCNKRLGTIWIMIRKMIRETIIFMFIFGIIIIATGMTLLVFNVKKESMRAKQIIDWLTTKPFFMFTGFLFLSDIDKGNQEILTKIMLSVFLLIGNALMLNLLVAIYGSVFNEVVINSSKEWKNDMLWLQSEYEKKTLIPPPLGIVESIIRLLIFVVKRRKSRKKINKEEKNNIKTLRNLEVFSMKKLINLKAKRKTTDEIVRYLLRLEENQTNSIKEVAEIAGICRRHITTKKTSRAQSLIRRLLRQKISIQTQTETII